MRKIKISSLTSSYFIKKLIMSGYSENEIAKCLKETPRYVICILNGEIRMTTTQIKKIEKKFNLRFNLLIRSGIQEEKMTEAGKKLIDKLDKVIKLTEELNNNNE